MADTIFTEAPEVQELANEILTEDEFKSVRGQEFFFQFCEPAPKKNGHQVYGTAEVIQGKNAFLYRKARGEEGNRAFFRITISADLWQELDPAQQAFIVRHELRHCRQGAKGAKGLKMRPHDVEIFLDDLNDPVMDSVCKIWKAVKAASSQTKIDF